MKQDAKQVSRIVNGKVVETLLIEPARDAGKDGDPNCPWCEGSGWIVNYTDERPDGAYRKCVCLIRLQAQRKVERYMEASGLTRAQLAKWRFDTFYPEKAVDADHEWLAEIKRQMQEYAEKPKGWRVLCGPYGCGKTHLAYAVAARRLEIGRTVYVATVPDLLDMLRAGFGKDAAGSFGDRFETIKNAGMLVLDDLGTQSASPWVNEKLYQIINHRYANDLPMIVTTNWNLRAKDCPIDGRILSRLMEGSEAGPDGMSKIIVIPAGDYRKQKRG